MSDDLFKTLSLRLDTLTANLPPEKIGLARSDPTVRSGMNAQREVMHRRGLVMQDRMTRLQRDGSRNHAVRDATLQGYSLQEAEALVDSYMGPRTALPVPDPEEVQASEAEAAALCAAAERLQEILSGDFLESPSQHGGQMGPGPRVQVTPGKMPATAVVEG